MSTTLRTESFKNANLRERTELSADALLGDLSINVTSSQGYEVGETIYVGVLGQDGCERAVVATVDDETTIGLSDPLERAHSRFEPVTGVVGDRIRVYRAINVNDRPPSIEAFTVLANRSIDADQTHTYYTDSTGDAGYWYLFPNWNELTSEETLLDPEDAMRGDDFGHYAYLEEILSKAGLDNAQNLRDYVVDQARRSAEAEINAALASVYTVPFKPVPEAVRRLTINLAAAILLVDAFGMTRYGQQLKDARASLALYVDQSSKVTDDDGNDLISSPGVDYDFGDDNRMFTTGQVF